jgi:hypothetical protein
MCRVRRRGSRGSKRRQPDYDRARRRPRTVSTTRCNVLEAAGTGFRTRRRTTWRWFAPRRHCRDQSASTARPTSPARVTHSITGCRRMVEPLDRHVGLEARDGTSCASSRRDWRRPSVRKGEPAGRWLVTRDSLAESKRSRRPGRTTCRHSRGGGSDGTPSMYASQCTPSLARNGIDSVRGLPRG